jgi:hypothetical protein
VRLRRVALQRAANEVLEGELNFLSGLGDAVRRYFYRVLPFLVNQNK